MILPPAVLVAKGVAHREPTREQLVRALDAAVRALAYIRDMKITVEHPDGTQTVFREYVSRVEAAWGLAAVRQAIQADPQSPDTSPGTPPAL